MLVSTESSLPSPWKQCDVFVLLFSESGTHYVALSAFKQRSACLCLHRDERGKAQCPTFALFLWVQVSVNSVQSQTYHISEDSLEILILLPPPPKCLDYMHVPPHYVLHDPLRIAWDLNYDCHKRVESSKTSRGLWTAAIFVFIQLGLWSLWLLHTHPQTLVCVLFPLCVPANA